MKQLKLILLFATFLIATGCSAKFVKQPPPLIECDKQPVPKEEVVTTTNAPGLLGKLYGYIEKEHTCLDVHRDNKDIR